MPLPSAEDIARALAVHPWTEVPALPGRSNHRRAGILVPLVWSRAGLQAVLTHRGGELRRHAGEVSWPGGRPEPGDASLAETALREAHEEIGVQGATLLGRLSSMPLATSDFRLEPFVAAVEPASLRPDGVEVQRLLQVDLEALLAADHIDGQPFQWEGRSLLSPAWELAPGIICFGGTAHVLLELLTVLAPLFGRTLPELRPGRWRRENLQRRG